MEPSENITIEKIQAQILSIYEPVVHEAGIAVDDVEKSESSLMKSLEVTPSTLDEPKSKVFLENLETREFSRVPVAKEKEETTEQLKETIITLKEKEVELAQAIKSLDYANVEIKNLKETVRYLQSKCTEFDCEVRKLTEHNNILRKISKSLETENDNLKTVLSTIKDSVSNLPLERKHEDVEFVPAKKVKTYKSPIVLLVEEHIKNATMVDICALVRDHKTFFNELGETVDKSKSSLIPTSVAPVEFGVAGHKKNLPRCLESSEMAFAWLLICLRSQDPDLYRATLSEYVKQMRFCFDEKKLHVPYVRRFRLLVVVLKEEENSGQQMIDVLLDGLLGRNPSFHLVPCMYNLVCLWETFFENPELRFVKTINALYSSCSVLVNKCPKSEIYEEFMSKIPKQSIYELIKKLKQQLFSSTLIQIFEDDPVTFSSLKYDIFNALFVAFAALGDWTTLYTFIRVECWPHLATGRRGVFVAELIGVLGRLGASKHGIKSLLEMLVEAGSKSTINQDTREEIKKAVIKITGSTTAYNDILKKL